MHAQIQSDVQRSLDGDAEAFGRLVQSYAGPVRGFLRRMVGDFHAAQDLEQETFLKAYLSLGKLASPTAFGPWLFRIAFHVAIDYRRSRNFGSMSLDSSAHPVMDDEDGVPDALETEEERRRQYDSVVRAVIRMPEAYALVLVLRYLQQRSYLEMAEGLDLTIANVKIRLHRARNMIRRCVCADD